MPWTKSEVNEFKKGLTESQKEKWVEIANGYLENCDKDQETCEEEAIKLANSRVGDAAMDKTLRVDDGKIKDWRYDEDEEVLTADVLITKSQVLPYKEDGEVIHELLPPDELREDSWHESIKSKAVTDLHPDEEVNYRNIGEHSLGSLHNDVWIEENGDKVEVWAKETVYDESLIQEIKDGKKQQVSIGRFVDVVDESGEFGGVKYDKKQTDFELNHLAHVSQGRAGQDVKVRLDGDMITAEVKDSGAGISLKNANFDNEGDEIMETKLTIGDKELELDVEDEDQKEKVESVQGEIDDYFHKIKDLENKIEDEAEEEETENDTFETEDDSSEEEETDEGKLSKDEVLDLMEDREKEIKGSLNKKMGIVEEIRKVDSSYEPDWTSSTKELQRDFIAKVDGEDDLEDRSDGYVEAKFDMLIDSVKEQSNRKLTIKPDGEEKEDSEIEELKKERIEKFRG